MGLYTSSVKRFYPNEKQDSVLPKMIFGTPATIKSVSYFGSKWYKMRRTVLRVRKSDTNYI